MIRTHSRYVIVGAGIHGLSTAWHLARDLRARGLGTGEDILGLDKREAGAGASGIACGTVRNNYFQPAMRELMAHSVSVWESDPDAFSYHPVGFLQIAPEAMSEDVAQIYSEQQAIGYPSVLMVLSQDAACYIDWVDPHVLPFLPQWHYLHIQDEVLPFAREHGVTEEQIAAMLITNPRRLFEPAG